MSKPIKIVVGNVSVKIYRSHREKGGRRYEQFDVAEYVDGKRRLIAFADEQKARDRATEIATRLATREGDVLTLTSADRAAYVRSLELLQPTGIAIDLASAQFAEAHGKLGGRSLMEAVNYFIRRNPTTLPRKTVSEVFEELIAAKKADEASQVYLKDLNFRIGKFVEDFQCQIGEVTGAQVNEWLRKLECGARSRNNYRLSITTMLKFAVSAGYIPSDQIDFAKVAKAKEKHAEIEIFTPSEITKLLNAARLDPDNLKNGVNRRYATGPGLLPLLILGAFAGLRTAEVERQKWEDINLDRGFIRVTGAKGNTAQKRLVPISDNLKQWLSGCRADTGLVCDLARTPDAIARLATRAGVEWKHNALRHSFISYRVAQTQDVAKVSLEAGNSPKMIHRHYRELVTPEEAATWFSVSPSIPANVAQLRAEAV